jgi:hypothetical protein
VEYWGPVYVVSIRDVCVTSSLSCSCRHCLSSVLLRLLFDGVFYFNFFLSRFHRAVWHQGTVVLGGCERQTTRISVCLALPHALPHAVDVFVVAPSFTQRTPLPRELDGPL